jgi:hypothetical protein
VLTPASGSGIVKRRHPRLGLALIAGGAIVVAGAAVAIPLLSRGGDAATSPKARAMAAPSQTTAGTPTATPQPQLGLRSAPPKPASKQAKRPAKGCRDYQRTYNVPHAGSALLKVSVCRQDYKGTATLTDTAAKDGWDVCLQLRGHVTGADPTYVSTVLSSKDGHVRSFDNGPRARFGAKSKRTEDYVDVNVGQCRTSGAFTITSWKTQDQLAAG